MNEHDFKKLSDQNVAAAKLLLNSGFNTQAYYLAGIAAECSLKAKISSKTKQGEFPPKNTSDHYSHDINKLLKLAGLKDVADKEFKSQSAVGANIYTVRQWDVEARYNPGIASYTATSMVVSVTDELKGFLKWLINK